MVVRQSVMSLARRGSGTTTGNSPTRSSRPNRDCAYTSFVSTKLTDGDREVFARKQALREKDRRTVAAGKATWTEMNRANTFGASVVHLYRPIKKLGLPQ